jgi:formate dehydrogenase subunit gamma
MQMNIYEPWSETRASAIISAHTGREGPMLPILHDLQHAFGYVPDEAIPLIASALNETGTEVYGVVTFYHDFRRSLPGRHVLKLCQAEACQACGSNELAAQAQTALGIGFGETTPDGRVTLEPIYCLGLCSLSPSAMLDGEIVARVDAARLNELLAETGQ